MFELERKLIGKKVAILATDGFEYSELMEPRAALEKAGALVEIVSLKKGTIRSWKDHEWGPVVPVDCLAKEARAEDYDALMLPGGVINADQLRNEPDAIAFAKDFADHEKPIAAICHAPWLLIETGYVHSRTMTSWPSLRTDLENAGAHWVNLEVISDSGWVTSRKPADIPAFNKKMIEEFQEGPHETHQIKNQKDIDFRAQL